MNRRSTLRAIGGAIPLLIAAGAAGTAEADAVPDIAPDAYQLKTLQYGTVAKMTSEIALQRARHRYVKAFAAGEILEQTAVAQALTSMANPPPPPLTPEQTAIIAMVQNASDQLFDSVYVTIQISGHRTLLVLQDALITQQPALTTDKVHIALITKAFVENHLFILERLKATL